MSWSVIPTEMMNAPYVTYQLGVEGALRNETKSMLSFSDMNGTSTDVIVGNLFPYTEYTVTVGVCNDAGCNITSAMILTNQSGKYQVS